MPWKNIRVRVNSAPWINNEFPSLIDAREFHTKKHKQCPCDYHLNLKKESQRVVKRMKNALKRSYVEDCLRKYKNEPKSYGEKSAGFGHLLNPQAQRWAIFQVPQVTCRNLNS